MPASRTPGLVTFRLAGVPLSYDLDGAAELLAALLSDETLLHRSARRLYQWDADRSNPPWGKLSPEFRDVFVGSLKQDLQALRVELAEAEPAPLRAVA